MSDIKLFRINESGVEELAGHYAGVEKDLQLLIERNMQTFFGIRFMAHEYGTGRIHRGFIDSLGLDEIYCPVIIEYKRKNNENIITQALFYLDWLLDHQTEFINLAVNAFGMDVADKIEFSCTRLLCVAADFSRFDERAITQIDRNVELIRYKFYENDLLLLELLNSSLTPFLNMTPENTQADSAIGMPPNMQSRIKSMNTDIELLYLELLSFAETLGEDVNIRFLKHYIALARLKNFTCIQPSRNNLKIWLNLEASEIPLADGFGRDVTNLGHHATGNVEVDLKSRTDLERVKPFIELAYKKN